MSKIGTNALEALCNRPSVTLTEGIFVLKPCQSQQFFSTAEYFKKTKQTSCTYGGQTHNKCSVLTGATQKSSAQLVPQPHNIPPSPCI